MAGKKGQMAALQIEVNTNKEWHLLLMKKGLVVVDVYSEWCGPCLGMVGTLKKVKLEIGGEILHFAIAKTDNIDALERFRNRSEPTWMFIGSGHLVNVTFGANAPKLTQMIYSELGKEEAALKGQKERKFVAWHELTEEESVRYEEQERKRQEALDKERKKQEAIEAIAHDKAIRNLLQYITNYTVVLLMPYLYDEQGNCDAWVKLMDGLSSAGFSVYDDIRFTLDPKLASELLYNGEKEVSEDFAAMLSEGLTMAKLVEYSPPEGDPTAALLGLPSDDDEEEEIDRMVLQPNDSIIPCMQTIYGTPAVEGGDIQKPAPESLQEQFSVDKETPAFWTPNMPYIKGHAILKLFPKWASKYALPPEPKLPPVTVIVYHCSAAAEVFEKMAEMPDVIVRHGFFTTPDPETAKMICSTKERYDKRAVKLPTDSLVIAVDRTQLDATLLFCTLLPLYASANEEDGKDDFYAFFKTLKEPEEGDEEEEEEEEEEELALGAEEEDEEEEGEEEEGEESEADAAEADKATYEEGEGGKAGEKPAEAPAEGAPAEEAPAEEAPAEASAEAPAEAAA